MAPRGSHGASTVRRIRAGGRVTAAMHAFPSPESVALVLPAQPAIGVPDDVAILLDLDRGVCREARLVARTDAQQAPFILTAEYRYWKQIIKKELGPIAGIMQRKVALQGSLP